MWILHDYHDCKSGPIPNETGWWLQVIVLHFPSIHRCTSDDYNPRLTLLSLLLSLLFIYSIYFNTHTHTYIYIYTIYIIYMRVCVCTCFDIYIYMCVCSGVFKRGLAILKIIVGGFVGLTTLGRFGGCFLQELTSALRLLGVLLFFVVDVLAWSGQLYFIINGHKGPKVVSEVVNQSLRCEGLVNFKQIGGWFVTGTWLLLSGRWWCFWRTNFSGYSLCKTHWRISSQGIDDSNSMVGFKEGTGGRILWTACFRETEMQPRIIYARHYILVNHRSFSAK